LFHEVKSTQTNILQEIILCGLHTILHPTGLEKF
jgi:hypothetical protein